jgi:hypothetical protein
MSSLKQCDPDQQSDSTGLRSNNATKPLKQCPQNEGATGVELVILAAAFVQQHQTVASIDGRHIRAKSQLHGTPRSRNRLTKSIVTATRPHLHRLGELRVPGRTAGSTVNPPQQRREFAIGLDRRARLGPPYPRSQGNPNRTLPILTLIEQKPATSLTCGASYAWYEKILSQGGPNVTARSCPAF